MGANDFQTVYDRLHSMDETDDLQPIRYKGIQILAADRMLRVGTGQQTERSER